MELAAAPAPISLRVQRHQLRDLQAGAKPTVGIAPGKSATIRPMRRPIP